MPAHVEQVSFRSGLVSFGVPEHAWSLFADADAGAEADAVTTRLALRLADLLGSDALPEDDIDFEALAVALDAVAHSAVAGDARRPRFCRVYYDLPR